MFSVNTYSKKLRSAQMEEANLHRASNKHPKLNDPDPPRPDPENFARRYQLEALEMAIEKNTIVFLETGSGKTLIAVMLLRSYAHSIRKPSDSIAIFLVPTVVLVRQQASVIEMHTDLKVGQFYGEMGVDFWKAATWKEQLKLYEVFVMTPQILVDNLRHRFFQLEKIKVLIFDECHHAGGRHPYACIMTEFYHRQLNSNCINLPRIFGMTASLVNTKGSSNRSAYAKQIAEIESLMHAKVYTVASESVLAEYVPFSTPMIKEYDHVDMPHEMFCHLTDQLDSLKMKHQKALENRMLDKEAEDSTRKKIKKLHGSLLYCLKELGLWSAVKASETLSCKEKNICFWGEKTDGICENIVKEFSSEVFEVLSKYLPSGLCIGEVLQKDKACRYLSSKVHFLIKLLLNYRTVHNLRCIVFVERVITSMVLQSLLREIKELSVLGIEYMAGSHSGLQSQTRKEHITIVDAFQDGKAKIIVATQILEEGLDVQSCNLVIRFDQPSNVCSFIQSRGRARMKGSEYLLIIRRGDSTARTNVTNYINSSYIMREESLQHASLPCNALESETYNEEFYCVESTGAKATLSSSIALIYFYCSRLPSDGYFKSYPRFVINKVSKVCTLQLPKSCPIQSIVVEGKADQLKQIACLEAIRKLHQIGAFSDYLIPEFDDHDAVENDSEESGFEYSNEQVKYFPGELVDSWSSFSCVGLYHCYMITVSKHFQYENSFSDIILVVKSELGPELNSYSFGLEEDRGAVTVNLTYAGRVHLNRDQIMIARRFQISVLNILIHHDFNEFNSTNDCLRKKLTCEDVAYLILPSIGGKINWNCVQSVVFSMNVKDKCMSHKTCICPSGPKHLMHTIDGPYCRCMLENSLVYTPHNGHFYCVKGFLNAYANSPLALKGGEIITYKTYFKTRHGIDLKWESESLLDGRHIFFVHNFLTRGRYKKVKEFSSAGVELPPEICKIIMTPISISTLYSFSYAPSIMHRIECLLLAAKLKSIHLDHCMQNIEVPATKVLEAITTKKCQEVFSLESLETLGDSFLKYATSQHLFKLNDHYHQGTLTIKRTKLISNASLCQIGCARNLTGFIRNEQFDPKKWTVPGSCHNFNVDNQTLFPSQSNIYNIETRHIKSKVVADFVEALIGAYLSSAGELAAFSFLNWLGIKINCLNEMVVERPILHKLENFVNIKALEMLLKYKFNDPSLLVEALTHGSYQLPDIPRCYQRLEFLGDAVLDLLITIHIYNRYPGATPGLITDLRSASVNNDCYAHAAAKAGLNKHVLHASSELHKQMTFYLDKFKDEKLSSGSSYGWAAGIALPKVLADVIESISGAIYIDSGSNKEVVWKSIRPLLEPMVTPETMVHNPLRELSELCSQKSYNVNFSKSFKDGVASIIAEVEANGVTYWAKSTGTDRQTAKKLAASDVLQKLKTAISES